MRIPLDFLFSVMPDIRRANVAVEKIKSMGFGVQKIDTVSNNNYNRSSKNNGFFEKIDLVDVIYNYLSQEEETFTVGPLTFSLYPGEILFIVGGNGAGKSTLAKLITGLYSPTSGSIYRDNKKIVIQEEVEEYHQLFSAVLSDFYLFDDLVGLKNDLDVHNKANDYLRLLKLDKKVTIQNARFSSINLSTGQKKRLALLVTYLEDRAIYVFDEWAADQDPEFKTFFYTILLPDLKARGKTVCVISHDDRYFHVADRLLKLNYGKIEEFSLQS